MTKRALIYFSIFLLASIAYSYDNVVVHLELSRAAAEVYNQQTDDKLTNQQIGWIVEGSQAEDTDPRYLNHYYDPTTGKGLDSDDTIYGVTKHFTGIAAKTWAKDQSSWAGLTGDYSVGAILENYRKGNFDRAYQGVGHIMHLVQDMAVPAHARNDSHAMGDPYEAWAKEHWSIDLSKINFTQISDTDLAFDGLANFSHNNFFSKDSIVVQINKYAIKDEIVDGKIRRYLLNNLDGVSYKIVYTKTPNSINPIYQVEADDSVNTDYWNLLYPKAVGYSAGVIDYFVKQFKQIDQEKREQANWLEGIRIVLANFWGETRYVAGDTILAESTTWQEQGTASYVLQKIASGFKPEIADQLASQAMQQSQISVTDTLNQTGNTLAQIVDQGVKTANTAAVLGQKVINTVTKPIIKQNPLKPKPAQARTTTQPLSYPVAPTTPETGASISGSQVFPFFAYELAAPAGPAETEVEQPPDAAITAPTDTAMTTTTTTPTTTPLDIIPPEASITSGPPEFSNSSSTRFTFASNEDPVTYLCKLDASAWQPCEASTTLENLSEGGHLLEAKAADAAGNESAIASSSWLVDLTAPTASLTALGSEYASASIPIYWSGEDSAASSSGLAGFDLEYKINDGSWQVWLTATTATSSIFDQTATSGDRLTFRLRATDRTGNASAWSEAQTTIAAPPPPPPSVFCGSSFTYPEVIPWNWMFNTTQSLPAQTLSADKSPYLLQFLEHGGEPRIVGTTTIEAGVVIKVGGTYPGQWSDSPTRIITFAPIIAQGTAEHPIIFTSVYDQDYCPLPVPESARGAWRTDAVIWGGIDKRSSGNVFENAYSRFAGSQGAALTPLTSN